MLLVGAWKFGMAALLQDYSERLSQWSLVSIYINLVSDDSVTKEQEHSFF